MFKSPSTTSRRKMTDLLCFPLSLCILGLRKLDYSQPQLTTHNRTQPHINFNVFDNISNIHMATLNLLHRLALAAFLPDSFLHLNFFDFIIIHVATWYLTLSLHRDPRMLNCASECFISSHVAIFNTLSPGLRLFLAYIMCWVPIWNRLFRDVSAEYWTRIKATGIHGLVG
jgi:hypothetical protein